MYRYSYVLLEKCNKTVHWQVGTYRYVPVQENVKKYVRVRTQLRTERYRAVQGSTGQYTKWYKAVQVKVQQGTRKYMTVHVSTRSAFAPGRGRGGRGGGRFWCAFEIAALTAPTVASASSHCKHKLVYFIPWRPCPRLPWNVPPPLWHPRPPRGRLAMPRQATGDRGVAASFPYPPPRPGRGRGRHADVRGRPAGGRRRRRRRRQEGRQNVGR